LLFELFEPALAVVFSPDFGAGVGWAIACCSRAVATSSDGPVAAAAMLVFFFLGVFFLVLLGVGAGGGFLRHPRRAAPSARA
jgi:hypothetical protein